MKKNGNAERGDNGMRAEYDFSSGVRGKYAGRVVAESRVILLEPDLAKRFPDSESVSRALREYLKSLPDGDAG